MRNGVLDDLAGSRFERQAIVARYHGFVFRLEGNAADAIRVAGRRAGHRTFPAAHEKIAGCRAVVGEGTIRGQVFHQAVLRIAAAQFVDPFAHRFLVEPPAFLPDVGFDAHCRHVELVVVPAHGGVAEKGQFRSLGLIHVGGQIEARMGRRDEGRHRPALFTNPHFAGFHVDADCPSMGQLVQAASVG